MLPPESRRATVSRWLLLAALAIAALFGGLSPALEVDDSASYRDPARSWAAGQGLREGTGAPLEYRPPAYPLSLGLVFRLFGESPRTIALFQVACHVAAILLVRAVLATRDATVANLVSAAALVYPPLLTSTALVLQESFLSLLFAFVFASGTAALRAPTPLRLVVLGAALGLAVLGKVTALVLLPAFVLLVALVPRRAWWKPLAVLGGCVAVAAPWVVRSERLLGRSGLTPGNAGHALLGGTVSNRIEDWPRLPEYVEARRRWEESERARQPHLDAYLAEVARARIAAHPLRWAALVAERVGRFALPARTWAVRTGRAHMGTFPPAYLVLTALHVALFAATALLALRALRQRRWDELAAPAIVFGQQLAHAAAYASPRYGVMVGPVLFGAAGLLVSDAASRRAPPER
jgi:hypothetical protein